MTEYSGSLHPGGRWHVIVRGADGSRRPAGGEFIEIDAPWKIRFTRAYEWIFPELRRRPTMVAYHLRPLATGTLVTVHHDGFAGLTGPTEVHALGGTPVLTWLKLHMERGVYASGD